MRKLVDSKTVMVLALYCGMTIKTWNKTAYIYDLILCGPWVPLWLSWVPCFSVTQAISKMSAKAVVFPLGSNRERSVFKFTWLLATFISAGCWTEGFSFSLATGYPAFPHGPLPCGSLRHGTWLL